MGAEYHQIPFIHVQKKVVLVHYVMEWIWCLCSGYLKNISRDRTTPPTNLAGRNAGTKNNFKLQVVALQVLMHI